MSPAGEQASAPPAGLAEPVADHRPTTARRRPAAPPSKPQDRGRKPLARRASRFAGASILVIVLFVAAGWLAVMLSRHTATASPDNGHRAAALDAEATTRNLAAAWVFQQVNWTAKVSCDPAMCLALEAHGIPRGDLVELEPGTADPLGSAVIVATTAVRSEFGSRLSSLYAPAVIASFGSGSLQITIRAIAPGGAAQYASALAADLLARKASGTYLLQSSLIAASAEARMQLAAGEVDLRLLYSIAEVASVHAIDIVAFGDLAAGASPGIPLRSADLTETGQHASFAQMRSILGRLRAESPIYPGAHTKILRLASGQTVLRIEFAAPSPLGLSGAEAP